MFVEPIKKTKVKKIKLYNFFKANLYFYWAIIVLQHVEFKYMKNFSCYKVNTFFGRPCTISDFIINTQTTC